MFFLINYFLCLKFKIILLILLYDSINIVYIHYIYNINKNYMIILPLLLCF